MKWIQIIGVMILFFIMACQERTVIVEQNGFLERYAILEDSTKHGRYEQFYPNGELFYTIEYENGKKVGEGKYFDTLGQLEIIERYRDGHLHGKYQLFYPNKQVKLEGEYIDGAMEGFWYGYYPSGKLKEKVNFKSNEENGPFIEYFESGLVAAKGTYLNGDNENDTLYVYSKKGGVQRVMDCDMGRCRTIWTSDSTAQMPIDSIYYFE